MPFHDDSLRAAGAALACAFLAAAPPARAQTATRGPTVDGYVQGRETWQSGSGLTGAINRARLGVDGTLPDGFSYKLSGELASGGSATTQYSTSLRDAFVRWTRSGFTIWAGQYKTPFSAQFLTPLTHVETADRAAVVDALAPKRDIGVMADYAWRGRATASFGVFNGEGQNIGVNRDSTVLVVGRATVRPVSFVTVGGDVARYRDSLRYGFDAALAWRGWTLKGEYLGQHRLAVGRDDAGWYALGAYEVRPWLQLVAEQEDFRRPAVATFVRNTATTIGANAYLDGDRVRLLANYVSRKIGTRKGSVVTQVQLQF